MILYSSLTIIIFILGFLAFGIYRSRKFGAPYGGEQLKFLVRFFLDNNNSQSGLVLFSGDLNEIIRVIKKEDGIYVELPDRNTLEDEAVIKDGFCEIGIARPTLAGGKLDNNSIIALSEYLIQRYEREGRAMRIKFFDS